MSSNRVTYHADWWVPAKVDPTNRIIPTLPEGAEQRYTGSLTYDETEGLSLVIYHVPSRYRYSHYEHNAIMWGEDANGNKFTLFNVDVKRWEKGEFSKIEFGATMALKGEHVLSLSDTRYDQCVVKFPFLKKWAFDNRMGQNLDVNNISFSLCDQDRNRTLITSDVSEDTEWELVYLYDVFWNEYDATIKQDTYLLIKALHDVSVSSYLRQIYEFSHFLSIALFCKQNPNEIILINKQNGRKVKLLYPIEKSQDPRGIQLIKYDELITKIPALLKKWHEQYERVSPIANYLVRSLEYKNVFDAPDFLIIAQALDGYHKRFENKKNGKDVRKYEQQMTILLKKFKDIELLKMCNIDPKILTDTRNKYSHLYPDEEPSKAVAVNDLYWLTEKCKVLLTCCILNMMGLTNEEINLCFKDSPIQNIVDLLPPEIE